MKRDFTISNGIYLEQAPYKLDLHNDFEYVGLTYSIESRTLVLEWRRRQQEYVSPNTPRSLRMLFSQVSEFRYLPRDATLPFSEDDCMNSFGYWVEEEWAKGVMVGQPGQAPDPKWLTAIDFMSDAVILVQAEEARALITK